MSETPVSELSMVPPEVREEFEASLDAYEAELRADIERLLQDVGERLGVHVIAKQVGEDEADQ